MTQAEYSTKAALMGRLPISLTTRDGVLTLEGGRLKFATRRQVHFDRPVGEFHSVAPSASVGLHVWHRDRCYKFVPGYEVAAGVSTGSGVFDVVAGVGQVIHARGADRRMREARDRWIEVLRPLIGEPPPGVVVRRPWPTWAIALVVVGVTLLILAIIVGVVLATS